jgi:surfactin family lipopeptide synthetase A
MPDVLQLSEAKRSLLNMYLNKHGVTSARSSSITRRTPKNFAPLSLSQQQIWLNAQRTDVPPFYNESITIHRKGPLDPSTLERSLVEILRRHEAWRTTFDVLDGHPIQIIQEAPTFFPLSEVDLRGLEESARERQALSLAKAEVQRPFDLRKSPLFRATLLRLDENEYRLYLAAHQIIIDGVTAYQVLLPELAAIYEAYSKGQPSPLPDLPIQYADFASWQRDWLQGEVLATQLAFWRKQLRGASPVLQWPNDRPRPAKQTFRGKIRPFALPQTLSKELSEFSRSEGVTLFVTLLTGFIALLHCYTKQNDLIVGTVSPAGRKRLEAQRLMGYFLNPVPLRADLSSDPTIRDLLSLVQQVSVCALSHDDVPFEYLVETLGPETDPSRNPFFQVAASLEPSMPDLDPSWNLTPMDVENGGARWDLYLVWDNRPNGIIGRVQYNPDLLKPTSVTKLLKHQEVLLQQVISYPHRRLSDLCVGS